MMDGTVGKHVAIVEKSGAVERSSVVPRQRPQRGGLRRFIVASGASLAALAFAAVNVVDPYSGATASPYYQPAVQAQPELATQTLAGTQYNGPVVERDVYGAKAAPAPTPTPSPSAGTEDDKGSDSQGSSSGGAAAAPPAAAPDPGSAQAIAYEMVKARGWGDDQFSCLVSLWNKESGWRVNAANPSTGAYGIPQSLPGSKMATAGADWQTNPATQITWGLGYIQGRYGTPCGAWAKSQASGWY